MATPDSVPVASNLLESKFLGVSVRRVLESLAVPLAPCFCLYAIGFPLLATLPLFVGGVAIGGLVYRRTPPGQTPLSWTLAVIRHRTGPTVYTWARPEPDADHIAAGTTRDEWLTRAGPPGRATVPMAIRSSIAGVRSPQDTLTGIDQVSVLPPTDRLTTGEPSTSEPTTGEPPAGDELAGDGGG